jgi:hypothetical protein
VSSRNRRDAKAARRKVRKEPEVGEPGHVHERIAEAVHKAVPGRTTGCPYSWTALKHPVKTSQTTFRTASSDWAAGNLAASLISVVAMVSENRR